MSWYTQAFAQKDVLVTARVVVHHRNDFESVPGIKGRSLKAERHQKHLSAATPACLLLYSPEQLCSQSLVASRRLHPELADLCGSAPCVPADAGNYVLTHVTTADNHMGKDTMAKDAMAKDSMSKSAMSPSMLSIVSQTVDLSPHVGHKVTVSGAAARTSDAMKKDTMSKDAMSSDGHAFAVKTLTIVAMSCQ